MSRMGPGEFKLWHERVLEHADEEWKERGLHDDSAPEKFVRRYLDAYKGQQWGFDIGAFEQAEDDLIVDNVFFSTINVLKSSLFARHPQVDVVATAREWKDNASRMERLLNHLVASPKLQMKREMNAALDDALLMPFGIIRHGFTPQSEKTDANGNLIDYYDPAKPDFPWIRRVSPIDIRIDPLADTFDPDVAKWCAFRSLMFLEDVKRNPEMIARDDLRPTRVLRRRRSFQDSHKGDDANKLVEVWTVYDRVERKWFQMSAGSSKPLREPSDWPIPTWQTLPYNILQFNRVPEDPFGVSYSELLLPMQIEINKLLVIANQLSKSLRRVIFYDKNGIDEKERQKLKNLSLIEFIETSEPPGGVVQAIQVGGLPQELLMHIQFLIEQIRATLGVSELERAQRVNVETATEASQIAAGASSQRGRNQGPWEEFLSHTLATFALSMQYALTDRIAVPILGGDDAMELFSSKGSNPFELIEPEQIRGEFLYQVRPGSTLPRDPGEEIRRELALTQALLPFGEVVNLPQRAIDTVRAFDKDPAKQLASPDLIQARGEVGAAQGTPPGTPVEPAAGVDAGLAALLSGGGRGGLQ